jgi:hypothetical protein
MATNLIGQSTDLAVAAVKGENTSGGNGVVGGDGVAGVSNAGTGVHGITETGFGVLGESTSGRGVVARSDTNYGLRAASRTSAGIRGSSVEGRGVEGWATNSEGVVGISTNGNGVWGQTEGAGTGVLGTSNTGAGVAGRSQKSIGVRGDSTDGRGVEGRSSNNYGIRGHSGKSAGIRGSSDEGRGVEGWATNSEGVVGISTNGNGVWGQTEGKGTGVLGTSTSGIGVWGVSMTHEGVHAETKSPQTAAIAAYNLNPNGTGAAIFAKKEGRQGHAGFFDGNVWVSGELAVGKDIILANADCAEDFDVVGADKVEPGTVMVLGPEGALFESQQAYDKHVAGVISGAGDFKPGIVLDKRQTPGNRQPVALLGKVFCKVDAQFGAIEVGDLLTTSSTPGHAMKTSDPLQAFGAVIGKALLPLASGRGLIPILVTLQ